MSQPEEDSLAIQRGDYSRTSLGPKTLFTVGRALTGPAQYLLITSWQPLQRLFHLAGPPLGTPPALAVTIPTTTLFPGQTYTFQRLPLLVAAMPGLLSAKHLLWIHLMMRERMTLKFATFAVLLDAIYETVSLTVFSAAAANPWWSERLFYAGFTVFVASAAVELLAELQRIAFKRDPKNKGKLCTTGFWAITRHINYTANVAYGFGYGLACGGPVYSLLTAGMYLANFTTNAIPAIETYCRDKYGKELERYESEVPYRLIPFVY